MPTIDFKPWAIGGGANVDSQAAFLAEAALATGFASGLAKSALVNKVHRQSSMIAAAVATFISNELSADVLDDGNLANLVTALTSAIGVAGAQPLSGSYGADSGTANAGVITLSPVPASMAAIVGKGIRVKKIGSANTGPYTLNINGLGATAVLKDGSALLAGDLPASGLFTVAFDGASLELLDAQGFIPNADLASMAANSFKLNNTGSPAAPIDGTVAQALTLLGIAISTGTSAFIKVGALVIQFGFVSVGSNVEGGYSATFPTSFPTACRGVIPGTGLPAANNNMDMWAQVDDSSLTTTGCSLYLQFAGGGNRTGTIDKIFYMAWGD